ncbi:recombinase family protein [Methanoplanus limicola]|uniref:Resolvase domain-containing protein n=1 Tax=Methanoplanus limicola DSM 2279 TaxID=937775 RepID=H1Z2M8_9EURY|nr:recombinase family protein [Methanoplanus limicola]EHQ36431.1 Resolvase domain-containing protein [Methanoplanus limicola DSM 2279]
MPEKVCIYARVSTDDQNLDNQIIKLKEYAQVKDFDIVQVYTDKASGKNTNRTGFQQMLKDLEKNPLEIRAVMIYKLDRIGRSLSDLIKIAQWLADHNIGLVSVTDNIDTTTPSGRLFYHIIGSIAEYEREIIIERTKAGLDRARAEGKRVGRPEADISTADIKRLQAEGVPISKIAKRYGVSRTTIYNKLNEN